MKIKPAVSDIINEIEDELREFEFRGQKGIDTLNITKKIAKIGNDYNYSVWTKGGDVDCKIINAHIFTSAHEWLYDLIWYKYKEGKHYALTEIILAMESEWGGKRKGADDENDPYGEVKYDFQKLLVCNSPLKLMVFKTHGNNKDTNKLLEYFQERINESVNTRPNVIFIIAYYYYDRKIRKYMCKTNQFSKDGTNI